jgi:O-antigen/teichoic acid export membrane protein
VSFIWLTISINGPLVLELLTLEKFHSAAILFPFLAFIPLSNSIYNSLSSGFGITDNTKHLQIINFIRLISSISTTLVLINLLGIIVAAILHRLVG